jgi:hypothetical protein
MIRMLIVGYCYGIRSERRLSQEVELHGADIRQRIRDVRFTADYVDKRLARGSEKYLIQEEVWRATSIQKARHLDSILA